MSVVGILCPHLIEGRNVVGRVSESLSESVRRECDEMVIRIDEEHPLRSCILSESVEVRVIFRYVFVRHCAVEDMLSLSFVVDARVVSPLVRCEEQSGDEIQFAVGCGPLCIS